jgi:hypothetical protein
VAVSARFEMSRLLRGEMVQIHPLQVVAMEMLVSDRLQFEDLAAA